MVTPARTLASGQITNSTSQGAPILIEHLNGYDARLAVLTPTKRASRQSLIEASTEGTEEQRDVGRTLDLAREAWGLWRLANTATARF